MNKHFIGAIMCIDYGSKKTGVAITDIDRQFATAFPVIQYSKEEELLRSIQKIVEDYKISKILIGIPTTTSGESSEWNSQVKNFANILQTRFETLELEFIDETYSSRYTRNNLSISKKRRKKNLDSEVAKMLLMEYLNNTNP